MPVKIFDASSGHRTFAAAALVIAFLVSSCGGEQNQLPEQEGVTATAAPRAARAHLQPTEGNRTSGTVTFTDSGEGIRVRAVVHGLSPGRHGFHVHQVGDCSAPDGSSAGGHFNPAGSPHGSPDSDVSARHAGDLGNLEAGADSTATFDALDQVLELTGSASIVGRGMIVHAGEDDFSTQPTGAAGKRLACGVIETG